MQAAAEAFMFVKYNPNKQLLIYINIFRNFQK